MTHYSEDYQNKLLKPRDPKNPLIDKTIQRAIVVYYCPLCGISYETEFFSKQQLGNHLFYDHDEEDLITFLDPDNRKRRQEERREQRRRRIGIMMEEEKNK